MSLGDIPHGLVESRCVGVHLTGVAHDETRRVRSGPCGDMSRDEPALGRLIAEHQARLYTFVHGRVRAPIDPADIIQATWGQAWPAIETGRVVDEKAYIYGIARNISAEAMRNLYRHARWISEQEDGDLILDEAPSAHRVVNAKDQLRALQEAVDGLPERCRQVFRLRHVEQLSNAEIAVRLRINIKQVEKQLRHALARCRRILITKNNL